MSVQGNLRNSKPPEAAEANIFSELRLYKHFMWHKSEDLHRWKSPQLPQGRHRNTDILNGNNSSLVVWGQAPHFWSLCWWQIRVFLEHINYSSIPDFSMKRNMPGPSNNKNNEIPPHAALLLSHRVNDANRPLPLSQEKNDKQTARFDQNK